MHYLTFIYKNLTRRPARSVLTVSGVAVAVTAVVALVGISQSFERSYLELYQSRGVDLMVVRAGSTQRMGSVLDAGLGEQIGKLPGVESVSPTLVDAVSFEDLDLYGVIIQGMPIDSHGIQDLQILTGNRIKAGDKRVVMIGTVLARNLNKAAGDTLELIEGESYRVTAIYESRNVFENGSIVMAIDELRSLMAREGDVTTFSVVANSKDKASLEALAKQIKALTPGLQALPTHEYIDTAVEIRMARAIAWITSTIALLIGTIGMINTMLTAVFERTRELALLRAIGWRKWSVMRLILFESVLSSLIGAAVGVAAAVGLTNLLSRMPASGRLVSGDLSTTVMMQGVIIAVLVGLIGGVYPAFRAAGLLPTEGLRHE